MVLAFVGFGDEGACEVIDSDGDVAVGNLYVDVEFLASGGSDAVFVDFVFADLVCEHSFFLQLGFGILGLTMQIDFGLLF